MITIDGERFLQDKINNSAHLCAGLSLINEWIEDLVLPDRIIALIGGGAVRDTFIKDTTPHDVDIFFVRDTSQSMPVSQRVLAVADLEQNLRLWLEDKNIQVNSLAVEAREDYVGNGNRYSDILEISYDGVVIQLMIPSELQNLSTLSEQFPCICSHFLDSDRQYHTTLLGFVSTISSIPCGYTRTDFNYLRKKFEGQEVIMFENSQTLFSHIIFREAGRVGLGYSTQTLTREREWVDRNRTIMNRNSSSSVCRQLMRNMFQLPETDTLDNIVPVLPNSQYTLGRIPTADQRWNTIPAPESTPRNLSDFRRFNF